jgi:hypothetical protein
VQNGVLNLALNAIAPPATANTRSDNNMILTFFITICFLHQKAKV